jgi:hypothetical protein
MWPSSPEPLGDGRQLGVGLVQPGQCSRYLCGGLVAAGRRRPTGGRAPQHVRSPLPAGPRRRRRDLDFQRLGAPAAPAGHVAPQQVAIRRHSHQSGQLCDQGLRGGQVVDDDDAAQHAGQRGSELGGRGDQ